ncbi:MAG: hypothetical protein AAFX02_05910 [Pseudomonadota bacterium]
MIRIFSVLLIALACVPGHAKAQIDVEFDEERRHHLSAVFGGTTLLDAEETAFTLGIDYEYRINELIGVGGVVEYAFGDIEATTLLAVADIHLWKGLAVQVGPGVEWINDETFAIGRVGLLYEIELEHHFTIAPQVHYDISEFEDSLVFGISIGKAF